MSAAAFVPESDDLEVLARAAEGCTGCPLYQDATQTVFGEGRTSPALMLVGEQPGDHEDRKGHPFVGPAGGVLWGCLREAGISPDDVYTTNAVKHFKHEMRGKRRIHQRPTTGEIEACHPWLSAEVRAVRPRVVVALGAVAARSIFGKTVSIGDYRGVAHDLDGSPVFVTYHPSAVLRADDRAQEVRSALVADLVMARKAAG